MKFCFSQEFSIFRMFLILNLLNKYIFQPMCSHAKLETSVDRMSSDGLNSLHYIIENLTEHPLYTLVKVDVKDALAEYNKLYDIEN